MINTNKLDAVFTASNKKLLSIYFTAGYPALSSTKDIIFALHDAGVDMIEIGMPYSDPIADGPVIQESSRIALQNGMSIQLLFDQLKEISDQVTIPLILMGYLNPVLQFGIERFCIEAKSSGVSAVILPDLPLIEYEKYYQTYFKEHNLHVIFLITPETTLERIKLADKLSNGFLYAVSSSTTTGNIKSAVIPEKYFNSLKKLHLKNPVMIGFGIKDSTTFHAACNNARGAIIGSAYISLLGKTNNIQSSTKAFIASLKK